LDFEFVTERQIFTFYYGEASQSVIVHRSDSSSILSLVLKKFGVDPSEVIVVDDTGMELSNSGKVRINFFLFLSLFEIQPKRISENNLQSN
jgi:hypothetical protein